MRPTFALVPLLILSSVALAQESNSEKLTEAARYVYANGDLVVTMAIDRLNLASSPHAITMDLVMATDVSGDRPTYTLGITVTEDAIKGTSKSLELSPIEIRSLVAAMDIMYNYDFTNSSSQDMQYTAHSGLKVKYSPHNKISTFSITRDGSTVTAALPASRNDELMNFLRKTDQTLTDTYQRLKISPKVNYTKPKPVKDITSTASPNVEAKLQAQKATTK